MKAVSQCRDGVDSREMPEAAIDDIPGGVKKKKTMHTRNEETPSPPAGPKLPVSDALKLADLHVEDDYKGLRMEGNDQEGYHVSPEFIDNMIQEFKDDRKIHKRFALEIILQAQRVLKTEASLVEVPVPEGTHITVCGDIHGQFNDLLHIWEVNGRPAPDNPYLFNGDFVDRGPCSVEVILTLLAYKVLYPSSMWLTRGNHETVAMNLDFAFAEEVCEKFDNSVMQVFSETFCCLPLAYVLAGRVFVVHGGLCSKIDLSLEDIKGIDRFREPHENKMMDELLWSDPTDMNGYRCSFRAGYGMRFGPDVTKNFLERNGLELMVRGHQTPREGYLFDHDKKLLTVHSASNYGWQGNKGAFVRFSGSDMVPHITQYKVDKDRNKPDRCN